MKIGTVHKNNWMIRMTVALAVVSVFMFPGLIFPGPADAASRQKSFVSPEEAVKALVAAIRAHDAQERLAILGQGAREIISSGDEVADKAGRERFLRAYDQSNSLQKGPGDTMILHIGPDNWPMPIPIVRKGNGWVFDISKGRQEILNRRIGRNELRVIDALQAYVEAQQEFATRDCSGGGRVEFAQRFISTPGNHDGLYWETKEGEKESPLGPLIAKASERGYSRDKEISLAPFHGYYFRILTGQGKHAGGGTYNYVVKGKMILGFALLAYPAEQGNSGVMTFMVNQEGTIYQKNLGKDTKRRAEAIKIFDPDRTWKKVGETPSQKGR